MQRYMILKDFSGEGNFSMKIKASWQLFHAPFSEHMSLSMV